MEFPIHLRVVLSMVDIAILDLYAGEKGYSAKSSIANIMSGPATMVHNLTKTVDKRPHYVQTYPGG